MKDRKKKAWSEKKMQLDLWNIIANFLCVDSFCLIRKLFPKVTRSVSVHDLILGRHVHTVTEWLEYTGLPATSIEECHFYCDVSFFDFSCFPNLKICGYHHCYPGSNSFEAPFTTSPVRDTHVVFFQPYGKVLFARNLIVKQTEDWDPNGSSCSSDSVERLEWHCFSFRCSALGMHFPKLVELDISTSSNLWHLVALLAGWLCFPKLERVVLRLSNKAIFPPDVRAHRQYPFIVPNFELHVDCPEDVEPARAWLNRYFEVRNFKIFHNTNCIQNHAQTLGFISRNR